MVVVVVVVVVPEHGYGRTKCKLDMQGTVIVECDTVISAVPSTVIPQKIPLPVGDGVVPGIVCRQPYVMGSIIILRMSKDTWNFGVLGVISEKKSKKWLRTA